MIAIGTRTTRAAPAMLSWAIGALVRTTGRKKADSACRSTATDGQSRSRWTGCSTKRNRLHWKNSVTSPASAIAATVLGISLAATAAHAQDQSQPSLSVDLNVLEQVDQACRLIFVATNKTADSIDEMALETVLFDTSGSVDRLALFDFKTLPAGKIRVRQFDLPEARCNEIGRILINGAASCKGPSIKGTECMDRLDLKSSSKMEIVG